MTTPNIAEASADRDISSMVMRVGVVANLVEADNISVRLSGSDVLVDAAYLFPQYQPLLGDRVVVQRQDSQWFVLGTMSGPVDSLLANPSFDDGALGAIPPDWALTTVSSTIGAISLAANFGNPSIDGDFVGVVSASPGAPGTANVILRTSPVPIVLTAKYTAAFWARIITGTNNEIATTAFIEWLDIANTVVGTTTFFTLQSDAVHPWIYCRLDPVLAVGNYAVPAVGSTKARLAFVIDINIVSVANLIGPAITFDRAVFRKVPD